MKKIIYSVFFAASLLASCSSSDDTEETITDGFSNQPVSGVIYSEDFAIGGGKASSITLNGVESLNIYLSETDIDCDGGSQNPIWITVPEAVGAYKRSEGEMTLQFRDVDGESFEGSFDAEVEIMEITETSVRGRVKATGFYEDENNINGTFDVQYCPL